MKINTRKFGEITIDEKKILTMPEGLPGFSGFERFVLLEDPKTAPFCWFQSLEEPNLALVIMDPLVFKPDYRLGLKKFISDMNWTDMKEGDLLIYVVVNIIGEKENKKITANLMGPLVINSKNNEAVQVVISDPAYSCQYNILESS
ncbi:MAG: flagellar assembly protein FliW [Desulfobacula sp.]|nr:flagellar assembly protein FliW [Desulfobacula sp.]